MDSSTSRVTERCFGEVFKAQTKNYIHWYHRLIFADVLRPNHAFEVLVHVTGDVMDAFIDEMMTLRDFKQKDIHGN